ncbi:MAG TPA: cation diffusion facilitator family transporter [Bacteroidales bacterium]|jgi:cation diffusion facilitator family transporter|nr:cation diffusion facilitator family transporter [Bacteroidales bacterium]
MKPNNNKRSSLTRFAWLSIAAAILTISLKVTAYLLTDSVGLLSDAMESGINLAGAVMALAMLIIAARPADESHNYGHNKAEYFSSGVEGILILIAAIFIGIASIRRFIDPKPIEQIGIGLIVSVIASLINLMVAVILFRAGKRYRSITLEADAKHLMTDVWTSAGVLIGVGAVAFTGWLRLDAIVAFLVACNIVWSSFSIIRSSVSGLMDEALPAGEQNRIRDVLEPYRKNGIEFHAFFTRQAGSRQFVSFHVLVPGSWTVAHGHQLLEQIEVDLRKTIPGISITTHLEPLEDPISYNDTVLERDDELYN